MSIEDAIAALDDIDCDDPERAHGEADDVLLTFAGPLVADAYARLVERCGWWASA